MSRETAYGALFAVLSGLKTAGTVKTCSRKPKLLEEMGAAELPALFMAVSHQDTKQQKGLPARRTLSATLYLYAFNPDPHAAAGIQLNGLIDAVEAALAPSPVFNVQTLSGQVDHAWLEGRIEVYEGTLGEKAAAILTVNMLVP